MSFGVECRWEDFLLWEIPLRRCKVNPIGAWCQAAVNFLKASGALSRESFLKDLEYLFG